jgi:hypothetical protein
MYQAHSIEIYAEMNEMDGVLTAQWNAGSVF